MDLYSDYFEAQIGGGARTGYGGISNVYVGSPNQRGHGIGSFLGGLFRRIIPLLKQGARTVGKEALRAGVNVASDVLDSGVHPREAFKTRLRESGQNLKRKAQEKIDTLMKGSGYKAAKLSGFMHSTVGRSSRRTGSKKRKKSAVRRKRRGGVQKKERKKSVKRKLRIAIGKKRKNKKVRSVADIFA